MVIQCHQPPPIVSKSWGLAAAAVSPLVPRRHRGFTAHAGSDGERHIRADPRESREKPPSTDPNLIQIGLFWWGNHGKPWETMGNPWFFGGFLGPLFCGKQNLWVTCHHLRFPDRCFPLAIGLTASDVWFIDRVMKTGLVYSLQHISTLTSAQLVPLFVAHCWLVLFLISTNHHAILPLKDLA